METSVLAPAGVIAADALWDHRATLAWAASGIIKRVRSQTVARQPLGSTLKEDEILHVMTYVRSLR
jgi:hypothetical protein